MSKARKSQASLARKLWISFRKYIFLWPGVIVLFVVTIFPTVYTIYLSFVEYKTYVFTHPFVGLQNYSLLMKFADFWNSLRVSGLFVLCTVTLSIFLGMVLALALNQGLRGENIYRAFIILPFTIAPVVTGFAWRYLLDSNQGLIGAFLLPALGIHIPTILGNSTNAFVAIVVADVWSKTPLMFLIILAGLQGIPPNLYRAARIDGANALQTFWHITLPSLKRVLIIAIILKVIDSVNSFDQVYVITSGGPGNATRVLALEGYIIAFSESDIGRAAALGVIMILISIVAITILLRYYNQE